MHDLGGLIWVLLVIVGVISSIARSARRNAVAPRRQTWVAPPQVQSQPQIPRPLAPQPTAQPRQLAPKAVLPPVVARGLPDIVAPEPSVVLPDLVLPANFHLDAEPVRRSNGLLGGMFEGKASLVRAIVAAEVLGKPKALQEQSLWSPRHSEPSM